MQTKPSESDAKSQVAESEVAEIKITESDTRMDEKIVRLTHRQTERAQSRRPEVAPALPDDDDPGPAAA